MITEDARAVIEAGELANVITLNRDGSAHVTLAWVGLDGDELVMGTLFDQLKLRNLRRDPRIAVSVRGKGTTAMGFPEYLVVYGRGRVTEGGAPELLQRLAFRYIGPGIKFPPMDEPPPGYLVRVSIERLGGQGPWGDGRLA